MSKLLISFIFILSFTVAAEEKGIIGFSVDVDVDGFFSPELVKVTVKDVVPDSPAQKAGILAGQKLLSIDGCDIPGCPARKAKKLMTRKAGDKLPILVEKSDGEKSLMVILVQ